MKIIFMCKYNVFRSKVAEAYFNKIKKDKKIKAISRGFISGGYLDEVQKKGAEKLGIRINQKHQVISLKELKEADKIIVVANDIPKIMFNYSVTPISKKVIYWDIPDEQKRNRKNIEKIVRKIANKIEEMVK